MIHCNICNDYLINRSICNECKNPICNKCIKNINKSYSIDDDIININYKCPYCNCNNKINLFNNINEYEDLIKAKFKELIDENNILTYNLKLFKSFEKNEEDIIDQYYYESINQIECHS